MIVIQTTAYNAEKTIERTINSVLNQTYTQFEYYIIDNGSTDETGEIIKKFAQLDSRIKIFRNEINSVEAAKLNKVVDWTMAKFVEIAIEKYGIDGYYCIIDADDEYSLDFLEKSINFAKKNDVDVVACGSQFVLGETGEIQNSKYAVSKDIIVKGKGFSDYFEQYLQFAWTTWGKLYSLSVFSNVDFRELYNKYRGMYGTDSIYTLAFLKESKKLGIMCGTSHKYYLYKKSFKDNFTEKSVISNAIFHDVIMDFLTSKNAATPSNVDRIYYTHAEKIAKTIYNVLSSDLMPKEKISWVREILSHDYTLKMRKRNVAVITKYMKDVDEVAVKSLSLLFFNSAEDIKLASDIFILTRNADKVLEYAKAFRWREDKVFEVLAETNDKNANTQISTIISKTPLLNGISAESAIYLQDIVVAVLQKNISVALDCAFAIAETEIPDEFAEDFVLLGQYLCAQDEDTVGWIFFKKLQISFMIQHQQFDKAVVEIKELEEMIPDDKELQELKNYASKG